ncbi:hypothetical protein [Methylobacterium sp. J-076]|uniref:hypothetical protein n=1 Tax=Methylobacterium sp. J-076 TaxID=2836655 RepID=UPI001FB9BC01|nr:hypothetical protein [Methylobacterium sp. J-076]MCJ2015470.1 hypothetical protein [Methylobacterium sp. J-076]
MSRSAQDRPPQPGVRLDETLPQGGDALERPTLRQLLAPSRLSDERFGVVHLFPEASAADGASGELNWPAAIELIRDVGTRMRQARRFAQDVVEHSQAVVDGAMHRLEEAERRLRLAESAARDAHIRAERAELAAQMADARARRAEEETELNRAKLAEAQMWLKRLYSSVQIEFRDLTEDRD